jgi:DNA helicase-2/ATP-dependent DNA helicase PcrA
LIRKLLLASAGAGKSALVAKQSLDCAAESKRVLLITYTINNQEELVKHICRVNRFQPANVTVKGWYSFLLEEMIRPYQRCLLSERVSGIFLNVSNPHLNGKYQFPGRTEEMRGAPNPWHYVSKTDFAAHTYFLSKLAAKINEITGRLPIRRLARIYQSVFIDEVQDLVGWDFEIMQAIAESEIARFECVGDFRQTVYRTSVAPKKPQSDSDKLARFKGMGFAEEHLSISFRCIQSICDLADRLHAEEGLYQPTKSQISDLPSGFREHHGVFAVPSALIGKYIARYKPVILRWDKRSHKTLCEGRHAYNFGEAKGLGFDRVLILPTDKHAKFLSGDSTAFLNDKFNQTKNKLYVGITRGRYSTAYRHEGGSVIHGATVWSDD